MAYWNFIEFHIFQHWIFLCSCKIVGFCSGMKLSYTGSAWSFKGFILSFLCQIQSNLQSRDNLAPLLRWYFSEDSVRIPCCPVYPLLLVGIQTIQALCMFWELSDLLSYRGPFSHLVPVCHTHGGSLLSQRLKGESLCQSPEFSLCAASFLVICSANFSDLASLNSSFGFLNSVRLTRLCLGSPSALSSRNYL